MKNWYYINKKKNFEILKTNKKLKGIQKIILANRDVVKNFDMFLEPSIDKLYNPLILKDMKNAVDIIFDCMMNGGRIRIVGDYDQDGIAATTILYKGLKLFYDDVSYAIPDRVEEGYGLNNTIVDKCYREGVKLIITCDNGIAAFEPIKYAKEKGINVIITDHHEVVQKDGMDFLPLADAVVNPSRKDDESTFKKICGAVVAYKLMDAIFTVYGEELGLDRKYLYNLLEFAALGTVVDMMEIVDENRIIVVEGLKKLNNTSNKGIKTLLYELNWDREIDIYTIGFIIGPIINSSGRIYTAKLGVELFLENDQKLVTEYARELIDLNNIRKEMTLDGVSRSVDKILYEKLYLNDIIILYNPDLHESICGLVAGRIKDKFNKPVLIFTDSNSENNENIIKGSGRSIEAYNMHYNLSKHTDLFLAFGGHKMACGLSMNKQNFEKFCKRLNEESSLTQKDFEKSVEFDYQLKFNQINFNLIFDIEALKPFGYGFKKPMFATKDVLIKNSSIIGKNKNVLRLVLENSGVILQGIIFNIEEIFEDLKIRFNLNKFEDLEKIINEKIDIVYRLSINEFKELKNIQLEIETVR